MASKVKFGIWLPIYGGWLIGAPIEEPEISYRYVDKVAQEAEEIGYDSLWIAGHLLNPRKGEQVGALEAWTTITAIARCTKKIKLGHAVLCQAFRYPAVLAKMASTLDEVSQGRFIFSIGAGWLEREFQAYGIPWVKHDELIEQAEEQIRLIKALWTQDRVDFNGKHYQLVGGVLVPKPIQKPSPPIWYGGNSEKSRQLVAKLTEIDCWFISAGAVEEIGQKIADMKNRIGTRKMEYATYAFALVAQTDKEAEEVVKKLCPSKPATVDWALKTGLVGSPDKIIKRIHNLEEAGINHITLMLSSTLKDMKTFNEEVIKHLH
jgi:alkanesulfonate monooxygenase SsuD/methylene tetrahydromethanopterin reductase-like flavin-dependent oxidoreductase (luciferase family)